MSEIAVVTGNRRKLEEYRSFLSHSPGLQLRAALADLQEIQPSTFPGYEEIIQHKALEAYRQLARPIIVDDVGVDLNCLGGFPGPFVKHALSTLGRDALHILTAPHVDKKAIVNCLTAYYDGETLLISKGEIEGRIVAPRSGRSFGIDHVFQPDGYGHTFSQMSPDVKAEIGHRGKAIRGLLGQLAVHNIKQ